MGDEEHALGRLSHGAHHLVVVGVADEDDAVPLARVADGLQVHLGHERTGGVDHPQPAPPRLLAHGRGDAVRAEDHRGVVGHLVELVHEVGALGPEGLDDMPVVHDLAAHVDRRRADLEGQLHDVDGAIHAGAEAARPCEHDFLEGDGGHMPSVYLKYQVSPTIPLSELKPRFFLYRCPLEMCWKR